MTEAVAVHREREPEAEIGENAGTEHPFFRDFTGPRTGRRYESR
jgi:hypothetical protein